MTSVANFTSRIESLTDAHPRLREFFGRAADDDPENAEAQWIEIIINAFEHESEISAGNLGAAWSAFTTRLEADASRDGSTSFLADAIRIKGLAMIALNQVRDYTDMSALIAAATVSGAAEILSTFDDDAQSPEGLPLSTILVRRLGAGRPRKRAYVSNGVVAVSHDPSAEQWAAATGACRDVAAHLVGAAAGGSSGTWDPGQITSAIDEGGLKSWRQIIASIGDDPWGPVAQGLIAASHETLDKGATMALREALQMIRKRVEHLEQIDVARRVSEYVAATGITQRAFAARIGTSPSRLSTYANGTVTPSAAMMLRIAKVSARLTGGLPG